MGYVSEHGLQLGPGVKLEPAVLAKHRRELLVAGFVKQPFGVNMRKSSWSGFTDVDGQSGGVGQIRNKTKIL